MNKLAILIAAVCTIGLIGSEAQAQHHHHRGGYGYGHRGHAVYRAPVRTSGFSISIGNGFNGFSYGNFRGGYGGFGVPVYRPSYGYGYGRGFGVPVGGFYGGYRGGYGGGYRGCRW